VAFAFTNSIFPAVEFHMHIIVSRKSTIFYKREVLEAYMEVTTEKRADETGSREKHVRPTISHGRTLKTHNLDSQEAY
jgi:hypothetical protein